MQEFSEETLLRATGLVQWGQSLFDAGAHPWYPSYGYPWGGLDYGDALKYAMKYGDDATTLIKLAKQAKRTGISEQDARTRLN